MKVVAFDIDGTLTEEKSINRFRELMNRDNTIIGIITARSESDAQRFVRDNNLTPAFVKSAILKGRVMRDIKGRYDADEYIYYGNTPKDRMQARLSDWEYKEE